ncbi:transglutaminase family protein [Puniceibacterium sp. IMCC21224]|uniref:transglutaminase family protein n=1 Tax=Puniceibacterium sp. IMCC21224 TaxID=1618204 RepID=UPI00064DA841|nr:transglutaminase family protein [Puniceibacterium sp. IMCC21224]KMK67445.1 transglutaminase-like enzyme, predicted cysteine protease [Puniceibacterium sp. IMCC21224]
MLYDIRLTITYDYGAPSAQARNVLRVMPLNRMDEQRRITGELSVEPTPAERVDRNDFFGNAVAEVAFRRPIEGLVLQLQSRVERIARPLRFDLSPRRARLRAELADIGLLGPDSPHHFLSPSPRVGFESDITTFVRNILLDGGTVLSAVQDVGRALHTEMRFDPEATDVDTSPAEAFRKRQGVCQDFSHVMIAGLRAVGIPAGYVSGFLRTEPPPGQPRLEGADAMHAWIRVWCGSEMGWIEYDPTNDILVGADHVSVAVGRDYSDVAPVKGAVRSAGPQVSDHSVDMIPLPG